jgi:hypothetical protein
MRGLLVFACLVIGLGTGGTAGGWEEPPGANGRGVGWITPCGYRWWPWSTCHPPCPCCLDDYCPKKLPPCPPRTASHAPDDYCPNALPHVTGVKCGWVDDYCPKPCCIWLPPCPPPWYTCGPQANDPRCVGPSGRQGNK